ncbi:hypothetical protein B0H03_101248 [Rathayibacter iranicus NCPPB 2253 = VKM Ac-1602]|uniref:Uncharacterized protein n=1 Tax=Rathayibacter iranicus NCPPB 2253 = VKM Ac-1602 TaxID=1328868 RepID=A0ABX5LG98_9MICO|nr:hypothetical protein B0H03_101248 [Rathayibacter iranicus NCPPB 2253 = VKM Ac-1602]
MSEFYAWEAGIVTRVKHSIALLTLLFSHYD